MSFKFKSKHGVTLTVYGGGGIYANTKELLRTGKIKKQLEDVRKIKQRIKRE